MRFEEYVDEHGSSLLRLAYVLTRDTHRAEDVVQTALAAAYRRWRRVDAARSPDAYVRRMVVNAHLDWHRRRSSTEAPIGAVGDDAVDGSPGGADPADGFESRDEVRRLLAALAPRARTVLVLRYFADWDDAAIAAAMEISESTVRATASRALAALREGGALQAVEEAP